MIRAALALLLLAGAAACGERADAPPWPPAKPALWAVENAQGATAGWLFGTIHALPKGMQWETHALAGVIVRAGLLVVEVRDLDPKRTAAVFSRLARDEPVPPLAARLPASERRAVEELLARKGAGLHSFDGLETWAAALALSKLGGPAAVANSADPAVIARFAGRSVVELEGAAAQLAIFDALSEPDQRRLLAAVVAEQGDPAAEARVLATSWLKGDLAALERVTRRGLLADPALHDALLARRNEAWMLKLLPLLESGRHPLVAVGTAHLLGPDGLPALLAAEGYRVRRIQ